MISLETGQPIGDQKIDPMDRGREPHESDREDDNPGIDSADVPRPPGGNLVLGDTNMRTTMQKMKEALFGTGEE